MWQSPHPNLWLLISLPPKISNLRRNDLETNNLVIQTCSLYFVSVTFSVHQDGYFYFEIGSFPSFLYSIVAICLSHREWANHSFTMLLWLQVQHIIEMASSHTWVLARLSILLTSTFGSSHNQIGLIWIIQYNLPVLRFITLIASRKFLHSNT